MKRKPDFKNGIFHGKPIYVLAVILLTVLLVISILTAVTIGSVDLSVKDVYSVILYKVFGIGDPEVYGVGAMSDIVGADLTFEMPVMGDFSVLFQFWDADEEFPAKILLLWDKVSLSYLHFETTFYLQGDLLEAILQKINA